MGLCQRIKQGRVVIVRSIALRAECFRCCSYRCSFSERLGIRDPRLLHTEPSQPMGVLFTGAASWASRPTADAHHCGRGGVAQNRPAHWSGDDTRTARQSRRV